MAGIGFSLRHVYSGRGVLGTARSFGGAAIVSCGPSVIASASLLALSRRDGLIEASRPELTQFQTAVTWILAFSLICTAPLVLAFTRFVADREYLRQREQIVPNLLGLLACTTLITAALALAVATTMNGLALSTRVLLVTAFVAASDAWIVVVVLASLRRHRSVLACFAGAYGMAGLVASTCAPRPDSAHANAALDIRLGSFVLGQACLVFLALAAIGRSLPRRANSHGVAVDCLRPTVVFIELGLAGFAFNLGCWVDEFVCWLDPLTSLPVVGPLRASPIYDLPSFAASACLIPGAAVFLVHVETELAERQRAFFDAVLGGANLNQLQELAELFAATARRGIYSLIRTQALSWAGFAALGSTWLHLLSGEDAASLSLHEPLFQLTALATAMQMLVSAVLSMLFYLDRRRAALGLSALVLAANASFCCMARSFGIAALGCGHVLAMTLACLVGLSLLNRAAGNLVRDTFMLQPAAAE
jgi:polysaccharide biosynthesis protein PelG